MNKGSKPDPRKSQMQGRDLSMAAMQRRLEKTLLQCGFTEMSPEEARKLRSNCLTIEFIPYPKKKDGE